MSNCELIRGGSTLSFSGLNSLEQLHQSDTMRDNWESAEPLVLKSDQQLQHQRHPTQYLQQQQHHQQQHQQQHHQNHQEQQRQTNIQEQRHHPPHSPTTPSWGIADRIVKEELPDEKNDDSGVSPGHYTSNSASPRSRRSSSVVNFSLSPGSATSDSQGMPCTAYDYSPNLYRRSNSPVNFGSIHSAVQNTPEMKSEQPPMDVVSNSMRAHEDINLINENMQCPICIFSTSNRAQFNEHLSSHYSTNCETPEFRSSLSLNGIDDCNRLSPIMTGDRSEHESEETDEAALNVPRVNSQGKVKTFRCRQCNYSAVTKLDFWQHTRGHIKADKLLTCPRCPFVTEYKHHLEYHLRNHFGSKPFKCDKCPYSCVNKSMLNSHLKSHSNVYQYRCSNCAYATKYCHSLKLHLRKYNHEPAMVLNADGSPNPLPIIDVYGTRRGPKQKPMKMPEDGQYMQGQLNNNMINALQSSFLSSKMVVPGQMSQMSPLSPILNMSAMNRTHGMNRLNGLNGINGVNGMNGLLHNPANIMSAMPYSPLFSGLPFPSSLFGEDDAEKAIKLKAFLDYVKSMNGGKIPEELMRSIPTMADFVQNEVMKSSTNGVKVPVIDERVPTPEDDYVEGKIAPLDLSKPNSNSQTEKIVLNCPKTTGTSRRKGKAVKLDRRVMEEESDEEQIPEEIFNSPAPFASLEALEERKDSTSDDGSGINSEFTCQFCEISFGNDVMYTVHMGYHGYQNPYTCNMCGHQCSDKVSFFLHIAKSKH
ncbi:protein hunchback-like isoform X2 [Belonocnema kinseyi]|uniref:protein hunchback-like isoform X2 n=1 Tax=Belonocnema kinseyi TaxID=2817044 RepID=UPI00143D963C|nr:protein hunchback-like isoform X2 [Belonocnema kinseyi]